MYICSITDLPWVLKALFCSQLFIFAFVLFSPKNYIFSKKLTETLSKIKLDGWKGAKWYDIDWGESRFDNLENKRCHPGSDALGNLGGLIKEYNMF